MDTSNRRILLDVRGVSISGRIQTDSGRGKMSIRIPSLQLPSGEITAVIGGSGCGKSVLLSLVVGYPAFDVEGEQTLGRFRQFDAETPATSFKRESHAAKWRRQVENSGGLFYLPQSFPVAKTQRIQTKTALAQVVQAMAAPKAIAGTDANRRIADVFHDHELSGVLEKPIGSLSGGERRRAELLARLVAMEMAGRPAILVLDEPTTGFDPANAQSFIQDVRKAVDRLNDAGVPTAALLSTHEMGSLDDCTVDGRHVINRICVVHRDAENCRNGDPCVCTVVYDGPSGSVLPQFFREVPDIQSYGFVEIGEKLFEKLKERPTSEWIKELEEKEARP